LPKVTVDFSRPPNQKERRLLSRRQARLEAMAESAGQATAAMQMLAGRRGIEAVLVRPQFVRVTPGGSRPRSTPGSREPSDRRLPDRDSRPPASRLISPRGAALRFYLTALFEAQAGTPPGGRPRNGRPLQAGGDAISWADLLASPAQAAVSGNTVMRVADKKARQLGHTLDVLAGEELAGLTRAGQPGTRRYDKYEKFRLLHEGGRRTTGPNITYQVPLREPTFPVPAALFTSGWIHVLEDTELAFILMLAARHHENGGQPVSVPGTERLDSYGLGRDAYEAHKMLARLGLVTVTPDPGRYPDGKVEGYNDGESALLHAFTFQPGQFSRDALAGVRTQVDYQLSR
jgi:hypothetical protein